jgi:hypothetical protein
VLGCGPDACSAVCAELVVTLRNLPRQPTLYYAMRQSGMHFDIRQANLVCVLRCSEESQVLLARLMSGYGRDASLNARERKAPGSTSITQLPGSPTASRSSNFGSEAVDGKQ